MSDARHMARALALAAAQLGRTAPNPAVGCVIVRDGRVLAEAATGDGGRPHAEEQAVRAAGDAATGACVFVTLEPCAKRSGGMASCADLLIAAGAGRVVVAIGDPHPNAAGAGLRRLRDAGIACETGLMADEAAALNAGFFTRVATGRPLLVPDDAPWGADAEFGREAGETMEDALGRLGAAGLTRVRIARGHPDFSVALAKGYLTPPPLSLPPF